MALAIGTRLGSHEVTALLGKGGMGEVYRARDLKLKREVAIKILPEEFSRDADRVKRFQREAEVLASLNHPNLAAIYGFEEAGAQRFLIMELVPGETLADRIRRGPIPADEALGIATQIAEGLEAAHELGIVHRDLKPANVKITPDGKVKVLDFGLAKVSKLSEIELSRAPTNVTASMSGLIMGTASYMSPEQASGKKCDRTSDVWAFGCVVYEMLTARRAFEGESTPAIIGRIFETEPDWNCLPAETPQSIRKLLRRCLQKESRQRLHDIADARIEIQEALSSPVGAETTATVSIRKGWREKLAWPIASGLALIATVLATNMALRTKQQPAQPVRLTAEIGVDANLYTIWGPSAIFSPDGTRLALLAAEPGQPNRIYVRSLDQFQATALSGTEGASSPFFSPDGKSIGFFAQNKLKTISAQGGTAITLCDAPSDLGGSWGEDDHIVFPMSRAQGGLFKVPAAGGTPQQLIALDKQAGESSERWPQVLPGGKAVLYASFKNAGMASSADIVVYSTSSGQRKTVAQGGSYARYVPSGHVVYAQDGTLFAVPFDLQRLEVTGQPAPVLEDVLTAPANGGAQFSVSANGSLVYVPGSFARQNVAIYWMDREGKFTPLRETPGDYYNPALSPDGKRLALEIHDAKRSDIWIYEEGGNFRRLTFSGEKNSYPVWTPDGQRIVYTSRDKEGSQNLWWIRADGSGEAQRLTQGKTIQHSRSWRPDGKVLAFRQNDAGTTGWDVMTLAIDGDEKSGWKPGEPQPFVNSASNDMEPAFSPDGRWLAYISFESGMNEVYVRPFPGPGGKWQISYGGGNYPKWAPAPGGKELFYRTADNKITAVTYTAAGDTFHAEKPQPWSPGQFRDHWLGLLMYNYDAHPDGKRFVVLKVPGTEQDLVVDKVNIVLNWLAELKQEVHK